MKAMIFAAGRGTRLGAISVSTPKALIDINGKTALRIAVENCTKHGFSEILVNVHHLADQIENEVKELGKEGFNITISDEREELLETGGGLFKARYFFDDSPFLLYNVDIITDLDLSALYNCHIQKGGLATLAVRSRPGNRMLLVNKEGRLCGWRNRATGEEIIIFADELTEIAFSGIHVVSPEIFSLMHQGVFSLTPFYLGVAKDHKIYTFRSEEGYWGEIGTPESLENARRISKLPE